jgi:hypothetical protein
MTDDQKLKHLDKFKKDFQKLMHKYPEIRLYGNMNGDVQAHIPLQFPNAANKHGNLPLTWEGRTL